MKTLLLCLALVAGPASAEDKWTGADSALLAAAVGTLGADWMQTRFIQANPARYVETNPILGQHPSAGRVNLYFAGAIVGTVGLAVALPSDYRKIFLGGVTFVETVVILRNSSIGIGMKF